MIVKGERMRWGVPFECLGKFNKNRISWKYDIGRDLSFEIYW